MTKRTQSPPAAGMTISHCTLTSNSEQANEHTRAAAEALAAACIANAEAITAIAKALQGAPGTAGHMINIGSPQ